MDGASDSHLNDKKEYVNTLNIAKRTVSKEDIINLGLDKIIFNKDGIGIIGGLSNIFHTKTKDEK